MRGLPRTRWGRQPARSTPDWRPRRAQYCPRLRRTLANYWPFATTIWDYINRAMPPKQEGSLSAGDVYALTAFILNRNEIIPERQVIDAKSLPKVKMPNRDEFVPHGLRDIHDLRASGCRAGHCP